LDAGADMNLVDAGADKVLVDAVADKDFPDTGAGKELPDAGAVKDQADTDVDKDLVNADADKDLRVRILLCLSSQNCSHEIFPELTRVQHSVCYDFCNNTRQIQGIHQIPQVPHKAVA
jgi:hypothetical protein